MKSLNPEHLEAHMSWPNIPEQAWTWRVLDEPEVTPTPVYPNLADGGHWQGLPLGGFGTGGIGRNYRGSFGRWTLKAGALKHFCEPANMFSVRVQPEGEEPTAFALHPGYPRQRPESTTTGKALSAWGWDYDASAATYHALFPKAWYHYPTSTQLPVELLCEQFSPVLPHNYRETSYPVAVFAWHMRNPSDRPVDVSLMFSFVNMVGWFDDFGKGKPAGKNGGNVNCPFSHAVPAPGAQAVGVALGRDRQNIALHEGDGQIAIAALADERRRVSYHTAFVPSRDGAELWRSFTQNGHLDCSDSSPRCVPRRSVAAAVCVSVRLAPGETLVAPVSLAWDMPVIRFGSGREHWRRYTRFVGRKGRHATELATTALHEWSDWSRRIDAWHQAVIANRRGPDWYYTMLFNEAYMAVDGLTVWTDGARDAPGTDPFFAVIECPDYPYYCTLDLWVYGSFLFLQHWPKLEKNVIRRFARFIGHQDAHCRNSPHTGELFPSKEAGAAPHDFGEPCEDPPIVCNSYTHQNSNRWKDLNCQFVLAVYRDVVALEDDDLLATCWPAVKHALTYLERFDEDGDGLIENDGTPDQTMDNIPMKGPSSYCGGLWLAAINAAAKLAERLSDTDFLDTWAPRAENARSAFTDRLWTGTRYRFDTDGESPDALFIDALFGIWYGRLCGLRDLVPEEHYREHLANTYQTNVASVDGGRLGGANITGWAPAKAEGELSSFRTQGCQISEVLSGLNISFACQLLDAGLREEAFGVLQAVHDVVYREFGLWFRTPAAWTRDGRFRAILNLRPLVIWALEQERMETNGEPAP